MSKFDITFEDNEKIYMESIEEETINNNAYRRVVMTTDEMQLVLMSIPPRGSIPAEKHQDISQFIRVEKGMGEAILGKGIKYALKADSSIIIPAGTRHEIRNTSAYVPLQLYTIYAFQHQEPPHRKGLIEEL